jgi:hypothetical protein
MSRRAAPKAHRSAQRGGLVMNISELCIRRPAMTDRRAAQLRHAGHPGDARLPGASPEIMAASVATPLEKAVLHHSPVS